jgi:DNA (cytosine-5)-methyltransferase 1
MKHGSLFSGIGGFDLASDWMGWENVFHCEIEKFQRTILNYHFPNSISYEDIKATDFSIHRGAIDILTGGFPCQPFSNAGKRLGKNDERHLWPEMLRAIREIKPRWIVGENVAGLLTWNNGMVFQEVLADLENEGYEVQSFIIPACAVNAPHRRDRVWIVAYSNNSGDSTQEYGNNGEWKKKIEGRQNISFDKFTGLGSEWIDTNSDNKRLQGSELNGTSTESNRSCESRQSASELYKIPHWGNFPTQSPVCGGDDGIPTKLDGITIPKWRSESIKSYGNAVVPQLVYKIFQAIQHIETNGRT